MLKMIKSEKKLTRREDKLKSWQEGYNDGYMMGRRDGIEEEHLTMSERIRKLEEVIDAQGDLIEELNNEIVELEKEAKKRA